MAYFKPIARRIQSNPNLPIASGFSEILKVLNELKDFKKQFEEELKNNLDKQREVIGQINQEGRSRLADFLENVPSGNPDLANGFSEVIKIILKLNDTKKVYDDLKEEIANFQKEISDKLENALQTIKDEKIANGEFKTELSDGIKSILSDIKNSVSDLAEVGITDVVSKLNGHKEEISNELKQLLPNEDNLVKSVLKKVKVPKPKEVDKNALIEELLKLLKEKKLDFSHINGLDERVSQMDRKLGSAVMLGGGQGQTISLSTANSTLTTSNNLTFTFNKRILSAELQVFRGGGAIFEANGDFTTTLSGNYVTAITLTNALQTGETLNVNGRT